MLRYTCQACRLGMHDECSGKVPPPPGMLGGSECICEGDCKPATKGGGLMEVPEKAVEALYPHVAISPKLPMSDVIRRKLEAALADCLPHFLDAFREELRGDEAKEAAIEAVVPLLIGPLGRSRALEEQVGVILQAALSTLGDSDG